MLAQRVPDPAAVSPSGRKGPSAVKHRQLMPVLFRDILSSYRCAHLKSHGGVMKPYFRALRACHYMRPHLRGGLSTGAHIWALLTFTSSMAILRRRGGGRGSPLAPPTCAFCLMFYLVVLGEKHSVRPLAPRLYPRQSSGGGMVRRGVSAEG